MSFRTSNLAREWGSYIITWKFLSCVMVLFDMDSILSFASNHIKLVMISCSIILACDFFLFLFCVVENWGSITEDIVKLWLAELLWSLSIGNMKFRWWSYIASRLLMYPTFIFYHYIKFSGIIYKTFSYRTLVLVCGIIISTTNRSIFFFYMLNILVEFEVSTSNFTAFIVSCSY